MKVDLSRIPEEYWDLARNDSFLAIFRSSRDYEDDPGEFGAEIVQQLRLIPNSRVRGELKSFDWPDNGSAEVRPVASGFGVTVQDAVDALADELERKERVAEALNNE